MQLFGRGRANSEAAPDRGDRLHPSRFSRIYWHLQCLKRELQRVREAYVTNRELGLLVDYGCGNMPYRPLFEQHVRRYLGCDLEGNAAADLHLSASGQLPLAAEAADIVLSNQVLEHVPTPETYLSECARVLRPHGLMILSTHGVWRYHPDPADYWRWTSQGLRKVVQEAGFEVVHFHGLMGPGAYSLQLLQDAVGAYLPGVVRGLFFAPFQLLMQLADRLTSDEARQRDAGVYVVVARKRSSCSTSTEASSSAFVPITAAAGTEPRLPFVPPGSTPGREPGTAGFT